MSDWHLYIVQCSDESLYTGVTINIERRVTRHNSGKGAKSVKGKLPVKLVYEEKLGSHSSALKREFEIKKLSRADKLKLFQS